MKFKPGDEVILTSPFFWDEGSEEANRYWDKKLRDDTDLTGTIRGVREDGQLSIFFGKGNNTVTLATSPDCVSYIPIPEKDLEEVMQSITRAARNEHGSTKTER